MKKKLVKQSAVLPAETPPLWQTVAALAACGWAFFTVVAYDKKFLSDMRAPLRLLADFLSVSPAYYINVIWQDLKSMALLAVVLTGCAAWGNLALPKLEGSPLSIRERLVLSLGLGFIFISHLIFLLGLAGGYKPGMLLVFLLGVTGLGIFLNRNAIPIIWAALKTISFRTPFRSPAHFLLTLLLLLSFVMSFVPELFYDSLVYHLGIPQMFINEGRMVDTPHVYFSRFPFLVHMFYVLGLGLDGGSVLPKLINWAHFAAGLAAVGLILKRLNLSRGGVWGILFVAAMPVVQLNVWSTAIDAAQGAYAALALLAYLLWRESGFESRRWLLLLGFFAGACFATKYTGVVVGMAFGVMVLWAHRPGANRLTTAVTNGALFSLMIFLVMSPYLIRNYVWTGNPTYPILANHLESRNLNKKQVEDEQGLIARSKPKGIKGWMTFPWSQTFLDTSSFNYIGPMTLAGLPLLLLGPWKKSAGLKAVAAATGLTFLIALQFSGDIRYLLPGFFLLSVLLGAGFAGTDHLSLPGRLGVQLTFLIIVYYHLALIAQTTKVYNPVKVLTGAETRKNYSATMHNGLNLWPWNGLDELLRSLPDPVRVYILGNEQVFGFPRRFWYSSVHDYTPLVIWANESKNGEELYQKLKDQGFTHILYNVPESMRLEGYHLYPWTDLGRRSFIEFAQKHLKLITVQPIAGYDNSLFLFALKDPADTTPLPFDFGTSFSRVLNLGSP